MKTVHTEFKSLKKKAPVLFLVLAEHKRNVNLADEVIYFWIIDNVRHLMEKIKYTSLELKDAIRNCSMLKIIEGYHLGGN